MTLISNPLYSFPMMPMKLNHAEDSDVTGPHSLPWKRTNSSSNWLPINWQPISVFSVSWVEVELRSQRPVPLPAFFQLKPSPNSSTPCTLKRKPFIVFRLHNWFLVLQPVLPLEGNGVKSPSSMTWWRKLKGVMKTIKKKNNSSDPSSLQTQSKSRIEIFLLLKNKNH